MSIKIYHNPRCSKSRQTLQLLEGKGIQPDIIEYLKQPPSKAELESVLSLLDFGPRDLMRKGETIYKELNLKDDTLSDEQLLTTMLNNPILIERPIVLANGKAAIGRPPESVLDIL
ncbi:MAG: arsenate reductase (glutaredoxin) [Cycloclasticus sp.]|nr:MAG: arsenate reductase [Cycloclasticus sp. Phe_18]MDF1689930.1 arsenate reductase (glutaredoxin) [Cycloclasticus sp.]MEE4291770.1 arsenate reductase (glutaredoxin) [Cycloclasticus sp.]